jgi:alcohol dehydrogenase
VQPAVLEIGVQYGQVKPGDVVAVVGARPVGLAVVSTAGLYGASRVIAVDLDANGVEQAKKFGATVGVNPASPDEMMEAYDTVSRAAETRALKVVIDR